MDRIPPQDIEAEKSVLGACLLDSEALDKASVILGSQDFYYSVHRKIFEAFEKINSKSLPIDTTILTSTLRDLGQLKQVGGIAFIGSLMDSVPSSANVEYYADIVSLKARQRRLLSACAGIESTIYGKQETDSIFDDAENSILAACEEKNLKSLISIQQAMPKVIDKIEQYSKNPGMLTGITTGFRDLDAVTSGFHPGELIIIAGRPGMGKTALCMDMARKAAKAGTPTAIYSLEMTTDSIVKRMLCAEAGIDSRKLDQGKASSYERNLMTRYISDLCSWPIFIDDESKLDIQTLRAKLRRAVKEKKIGLAVVDYIQLMDAKTRTENRQQEITLISRGLKSIAKELQIPLIVASQLSRATESRDKSKPRLSDLRESGSIEQDADAVMLIYRPDYYEKSGEDKTATIDIAKQRSGPTGDVLLVFRAESTTFMDMAQPSEGSNGQ